MLFKQFSKDVLNLQEAMTYAYYEILAVFETKGVDNKDKLYDYIVDKMNEAYEELKEKIDSYYTEELIRLFFYTLNQGGLANVN